MSSNVVRYVYATLIISSEESKKTSTRVRTCTTSQETKLHLGPSARNNSEIYYRHVPIKKLLKLPVPRGCQQAMVSPPAEYLHFADNSQCNKEADHMPFQV
jgi:hypothetical protein